MKILTKGNPDADILFVGEIPGMDEEREGIPFAGYSGQELDAECIDAGINPSRCFYTNVAHKRPFGSKMENLFYNKTEAKERGISEFQGTFPDPIVTEGLVALREIVEKVQPNIIIALGSLALWAFIGDNESVLNSRRKPAGIVKWRGSVMEAWGRKVAFTYNPAYITRNWSDRWTVVQDLRRFNLEATSPVVTRRNYNFTPSPTFPQAIELLENIRGKQIAVDVETRRGLITSIAFAWSEEDAFCIPFSNFIENEEGYWDLNEETQLILKIRETLCGPNTLVCWQNGIYDIAYITKLWGFIPNHQDDTFLMQHVSFPGLSKSLNFIASMYADPYCYWKDEGKEFIPGKHDVRRHRVYNCLDAVYTLECLKHLRGVIRSLKLEEQYAFLMRMYPKAIKTMLWGILVDGKARNRISGELLVCIQDRAAWLEKVLGHPLNVNSNSQMTALLYEDFKCRVRRDQKTNMPSLKNIFLEEIKVEKPILIPLVNAIQETRSLYVFKRNFTDDNPAKGIYKTSYDGRVRSQINLGGTETFRLTFSEDPFGSGMNMQAIPPGSEED